MNNSKTAPADDTAVSIFNFRGFDLRCVEIEGQPWFVAVDLCTVLFGKTTGLSKRGGLAEDEKRLLVKKVVSASGALSSLFVGTQYRLALISESGL